VETPTLNYQSPPETSVRKPIWRRVPLYIQILIVLVLGVALGLVINKTWAARLNVPASLILRLLGAIAPPLILVAVMQALIRAKVGGRMAGRMFFLLILNTLVAIMIGLTVANVLRPGKHASLHAGEPLKIAGDPITQFLENIPSSLLQPLVDNKVIGVIFIAVAFGIAARKLTPERRQKVSDTVDIVYDLVLIILHWIIALVPIAVLCKVAYVVGTQGFRPFLALAWFIVAVIIALALQATYYLLRIKFGSWVRPTDLLRAGRDALAMAFSTASSTVTMPVTYSALRERVGLREESASLGALVGSNFNNDGTALYEAMAALFVAQMLAVQGLGMELTLGQQLPSS
jgi:Na+/H+-dicarboxylate symporter